MQRTLDAQLLQTEIMSRGYAELDHNISLDQIDSAVDCYGQFTLNYPDPLPETMHYMLPVGNEQDVQFKLDQLDYSKDAEDQWHKYRTNTPGIRKPDGYTNRSFQIKALEQTRGLILPEEDSKEYYHYTPAALHAIENQHAKFGWGVIPPEVYKLHEAIQPIHAKASQLIMRVCAQIEEFHPEIRDYITAHSLRTSPIRLLFYHPTQAPVLAADHFDKGWLTVQIAESHHGLMVAPNKDAELAPVTRDANKAVFFPAWGLQEKFEDTHFKPGWHGVSNLDTLNSGRKVPETFSKICGRYAIIFFAGCSDFKKVDKQLLHSRV